MAFIVCPIVFYIPRFFEIRSFIKVYAYNVTIDCSELFLNEPGHQLMFLKDNQSQSFLKVLNQGKLQFVNQYMSSNTIKMSSVNIHYREISTQE